MKTIKVTCAIVEHQNKTLVVQRGENMKMPLKWEFPGGKVEQGESDEECIKREIKEELNIEIELISTLLPSQFEYPNITIKLFPFLANYINGDIKLSEHKQYQFLSKDKLIDLDWAEADIAILKEYLSL